MTAAQNKRLRVLIVDDSSVHRQALSGLLSRDPELEIAGWAASGTEALRVISHLHPDVVTLDEHMPGIDGLETARRIMHEAPTPIVMITGDAAADKPVLRDAASAAGVLAVQSKHALLGNEPGAAAELVRVIKGMAAVRLVRRRREPVVPTVATPSGPRPDAGSAPTTPQLVAIGASTGGPQALREIITRLPGDFCLPVLVVQHTTAGYTHTLVDWLRMGSKLPVNVAVDGQAFTEPGIYVAPTERHMVVRGRYLGLLDTPPCSLHRPSATVLFRSVAQSFGPAAMGVLLTGMGDDGAVGLLEMKRAGAFTIAQDEATSIVFGMPAEAIRLGAADLILPPAEIPGVLLEHLSGASR